MKKKFKFKQKVKLYYYIIKLYYIHKFQSGDIKLMVNVTNVVYKVLKFDICNLFQKCSSRLESLAKLIG